MNFPGESKFRKDITRREFLTLLFLLIGGFTTIQLIRKFVEKRHLEGFWEIFSKKENKEKLKNFIEELYPNKNPQKIIETAYRIILIEQHLLGFFEKLAEVFGIGKTKGLGQLHEKNIKELQERAEVFKDKIYNFLSELFPNREISLTDYHENPVLNFILVIIFIEYLREKAEEFIPKDNLEKILEKIDTLSQKCDKFFNLEEDLKIRKEIAIRSFEKLDEIFVITAYPTKETAPLETWIQVILNIINLLENKEVEIKVDGDIGEETIKRIKELGIKKVKFENQEFELESFWQSDSIDRSKKVITLQNLIYEKFNNDYLNRLMELFKRLLGREGEPIKKEDEELLIKLIKSSYFLKIGYHSLIDYFLEIKIEDYSYWENEIKRIKLLEDDFHSKWFDYIFNKKENRIFDLEYISNLTKRDRENLIKHLARAILIRFSILLESKIDVPEQVESRMTLYATLGEKLQK